MEIRNSSFIYPNKKSIDLLSKNIEELKFSFNFIKSKVQSSDIYKIISTAFEGTRKENVKKEEPIILYKTPLRLYNNGNNCYINSSIQALLPTINNDLKTSLRSARQHNFPAIELFNLYLDKLENKSDCWTPSNHIRNLKYFSKNFRNGAQEDAQEFLNGFLDRLREEFDKIDRFKGCNNPIRKTYAPFYDCRYYCLKCKKSNIKSPQIQEELTFFLELDRDLPGMINMALKTQNNNFKCDNCKTTNGSAAMDAVFTSLPKTFICCVKRFKHNFFNSSKNGRDVDFCKYIQLPYVDQQGNRSHATYDIAAVVIHLGSSLSGGHYECISKLGGQWHRISDSSVAKINEVQAIMSTKNSSYIYIFTETSRNGVKADLKRKFSDRASLPTLNLSKNININNNHNKNNTSSSSVNNSDLKRKLSEKSFSNSSNNFYNKHHNSFKRHKPDFKTSKNHSFGFKSMMTANNNRQHNTNFSNNNKNNSNNNNNNSNSNNNSNNNSSNSNMNKSSSSSSSSSSFPKVNSPPLNCNSNPVVCQNS